MNPIKLPDSFKKFGGILGKGLTAQFAQALVKGALVELLKGRKVDVEKATIWIESNTSLWDTLGPHGQEQLRRAAKLIGNVEWLTTAFVIDSLRKELPSVASLFLGWLRARHWLERQVKQIKEEIES